MFPIVSTSVNSILVKANKLCLSVGVRPIHIFPCIIVPYNINWCYRLMRIKTVSEMFVIQMLMRIKMG